MSSNPSGAPTAESLLAPQAPYRGLTPYLEQDAPLFFGREEECEVVINNLLASRVTLLYGASGVGKTSLLRAGVTHELLALSRRNSANYGSPEHVVVYFNRWSDDPVAALNRRVHDAVATAVGGYVQEPEIRSPGLVETLHGWTTNLGSDLLIILDQFEEYFLYHPDSEGDGSFAVEFPRAVNRPDLRVSFLVAIREDALARLDHFKGRIPNLFDNYLRTRHLDADAARAAIEKPLEAYNRLVAADEPFTAEPELVRLVLDQVQIGKVFLGAAGRGVVEKSAHQEATGQQIETPYLQLVLTRLWREEIAAGSHTLRAETLRRLGGAQQIVHTHLNEAVRALPARQQDVAAGIFHYLVTPSGTKIAHTAPDLADYAQLPRAEVESVLQELSKGDARILRPIPPPSGQPHAQPAYEIFHDVLAPAILEWRASHVVAQAAEERLHEARRRLRRLGSLAAALAILLIATVAFAVLGLYQSHQADTQRQRAITLARLAASRELSGEAATTVGDDPRTALRLGIAAERLYDDADARASLVHGLTSSHYAGIFAGHRLGVNSVALSPDGRILATAGADGKVILWDVARRTLLGQPLSGQGAAVWSVAFSPDGRILATASADKVILWDVARRAPLGSPLRGHDGEVTAVAFSPDGRTLASGGKDATVRLWDVARRAPLGPPLSGHHRTVWSLAFSPDGHTLASGSKDTTVRLWDVTKPANPARLGRLTGHTGPVNSVAFSPDGHILASGSSDTTVILRSMTDRAHPVDLGRPLRGQGAAVWSVAFSPDGRTLATGRYDTSTNLYHIGNPVHPVLFRRLNGHHSAVTSVAFSPDNHILVTGSLDATAIRWDMEEVELARRGPPLQGNGETVESVAFSPDGRILATASADKVILWDAARRAPLGSPLRGHDGEVTAVAFSPDGRTLASGGDDKTIRLWDVTSRTPLGPPLNGHEDAVNSVAFSPDGHTLASGGDDNVVRLWDVTKPASAARLDPPLQGHNQGVSAVAFSPDGQTLASGSDDGDVIFWRVADPARPTRLGKPLTGHDEAVATVAFSPDGRTFASGGDDRRVLVWDVADRAHPGRLGQPLTGPKDAVTSVAFSPDGRTLIAGSDDGSAVPWNLAPLYVLRDGAVDRACVLAGGGLDRDEWSRYVSGPPYEETCPKNP
jgi:WD40 repeat protein